MQSIPYTAEEKRILRDAKSVLLSSNWPDLPPDLLRLIYRKLYDTFDFINFRAVCKSWLAAAPLSDHPPQFPFLIERETSSSSKFKLYSLHTSKTHRIQVPEARNKLFFGQSQGYLVTYKIGDDDTSLTLLNPFTRAEVHLPFHGFNYLRHIHVGADPIWNSDVVVLYKSLGYGCRFVGLWKNEDNEWVLKGSFPSGVEAYHRGRLFISQYHIRNYITTIIDLTTGNNLEVRLPYSDVRSHYFSFLGEGAGAFLGIQRHFYSRPKYEYMSLEKCSFEVYRLDEEQKPPCWVKLSDIGDLIIFLNSDSTGFCLLASDFDGISGNCIYFLEMVHGGRSLIGLYELGKDGSEVIGQLESQGTWIVPNVY